MKSVVPWLRSPTGAVGLAGEGENKITQKTNNCGEGEK